jgi:Glycosyl transferase family 2
MIAVLSDLLHRRADRARLAPLRHQTTPESVSDRHAPVPIFVISFNRGAFLRQVIQSYLALRDPVEIVIVDNGSDDEQTLDYLSESERTGVQVYRRGRISTADDLNRVDAAVQEHFANIGRNGRYVVTDCDISLAPARTDSLSVLSALLDAYPGADCVGPMLRIRDVPTSYPLFAHAMNRHIEQFWQHRPIVRPVNGERIAILPGAIDTTFAMHRAGQPFRRLKQGLRVYAPFEALHLDWYQGADHGRSHYAATSAKDVAHWGTASVDPAVIGAPLIYRSYLDVEITGGRPRIVRRPVAGN